MKHSLITLPIATLLAVGQPAAGQQGDKLGNINVAGVAVDGLTPPQARQRVRRQLGHKLDTTIRLTDGVKAHAVARRHLGVGVDASAMIARAKVGQKYVPLELKVDRLAMQAALRRVADRFAFPGREARVYEWNGEVKIAPSLHSRAVDAPTSAQRIADEIEEDATTRTARLVLDKAPPEVSTEDLQGINGRLSRYTTSFNPNEARRTKNMRLGIRLIDGTLLKPGETFSLNDTVGERKPSRGFRKAIIFEDRQLAYDYGGGISQVTGTLFNAALEAGLPIVSYRTHTRPVDYIPIGRDATVSFGDFDMKFRNDTDAPVYIAYQISGRSVIATLYGNKTPGQQVNINVTSQKLGPREIKAKLWRTVKVNGDIRRKEMVGTSHYKWERGWTS